MRNNNSYNDNDLKSILREEVKKFKKEAEFHTNINRSIKKLMNAETIRHIEQVGKYTQKIENILLALLGINIEVPVELITLDEEMKMENASYSKDKTTEFVVDKLDKISRLFKRGKEKTQEE